MKNYANTRILDVFYATLLKCNQDTQNLLDQSRGRRSFHVRALRAPSESFVYIIRQANGHRGEFFFRFATTHLKVAAHTTSSAE